MRKIFYLMLIAAAPAMAQNMHHCGQGKNTAEVFATKEELRNERAMLEDFTKQFDIKSVGGNITIPVVFHVNDPSNPQKVTLAQAESAIDILNEDFNAQNPDYGNVRQEFMNIRANVGVTFCLAAIDPDGNPTNGVTYHQNSYNGREPDGYGSSVKSVEYWPGNQYLNIWIVNETEDDGSLYNSGWAFLPSTYWANNDLDGIVFNHRYLGYGEGSSEVSGTNSWQAEMARVLTHEVGHYLNLHHTFENYCSSPGDECDDTPYVYYHGSNNCEQLGDKCAGVTLVNDENYMDYTPCPRMYTSDQRTRMIAALNSSVAFRNQLWTNGNLKATGCAQSNVGINDQIGLVALDLFPNPATDILVVQYSTEKTGQYQLSIFGVMGQTMEVQANVFLSELGTYEVRLPAQLAEGVYVLQLRNEEGVVANQRFVKH